MNIKRIKLKSFRNYEDQEIQLGKTSIFSMEIMLKERLT